jgi:hypothetical protein
MTSDALKGKCRLFKTSLLKVQEFLKHTDECHKGIQEEIDKMKLTMNGEEYWMTPHKPPENE